MSPVRFFDGTQCRCECSSGIVSTTHRCHDARIDEVQIDETCPVPVRGVTFRLSRGVERMEEEVCDCNLADAMAMLSDPDARVRLAGVVSIGQLGSASEGAATQVCALLRDKSDEIRKRAMSTLCGTGHTKEVITRLPKLVNDPSPDVRMYAKSLAKDLGLEVQTIIDVLFDRTKDRGNAMQFGDRWELIDFVGSLGVAAVLPLIELLEDEDDDTVNCACGALAQFGPVSAEAVPKLVDLLESDRTDTWTEAALAIAAIGPASHQAVPRLIEFLEHDVFYYAFFEALGGIGAAAAEAMPELIRIFWQFGDDDEFQDLVGTTIREIGFDSLPRFRLAAIQAIPVLLKRLQTHYSWFEEKDIGNATVAIFRIALEIVVPRLLEARLSGEQPHAYQTIEVLEKIGPAAISLLLEQAVASSQSQIQDIVESVILELDEDARPALLEASKSSKHAVASLADRLLELIDQEADEPPEQEATNATFDVESDADITVTDETILSWFTEIDLEEYLKPLQVFWCIGCLERASVKSGGPALGVHKLARSLKTINPMFKFRALPIGATYLRRVFLDIDSFFDREPFYSNAWSDEERGQELRPEFMKGERRQARWTTKAWTAWSYIDRFLRLRNLLPTLNGGTRLY